MGADAAEARGDRTRTCYEQRCGIESLLKIKYPKYIEKIVNITFVLASINFNRSN
jgi:hypothetical protein